MTHLLTTVLCHIDPNIFTRILIVIYILPSKSTYQNHVPLKPCNSVYLRSICGHGTPIAVVMYCASKHAVTVLTEGLRRELVNLKSKIRVTVSIQLIVLMEDAVTLSV
jgi:NADP-dependent 3-hydroxy acid dehydrogenase YdfG